MKLVLRLLDGQAEAYTECRGAPVWMSNVERPQVKRVIFLDTIPSHP